MYFQKTYTRKVKTNQQIYKDLAAIYPDQKIFTVLQRKNNTGTTYSVIFQIDSGVWMRELFAVDQSVLVHLKSELKLKAKPDNRFKSSGYVRFV